MPALRHVEATSQFAIRKRPTTSRQQREIGIHSSFPEHDLEA